MNITEYRARRHRVSGPLDDTRGAAGRARAIRAAVLSARVDGPDAVEAALAAALTAGDRCQLRQPSLLGLSSTATVSIWGAAATRRERRPAVVGVRRGEMPAARGPAPTVSPSLLERARRGLVGEVWSVRADRLPGVSGVSVLEREMYSEAEAARLLGVAQSTLNYWLEGGTRRGRVYRPVIRPEPRAWGTGAGDLGGVHRGRSVTQLSAGSQRADGRVASVHRRLRDRYESRTRWPIVARSCSIASCCTRPRTWPGWIRNSAWWPRSAGSWC